MNALQSLYCGGNILAARTLQPFLLRLRILFLGLGLFCMYVGINDFLQCVSKDIVLIL